jgi:hypothetical protein
MRSNFAFLTVIVIVLIVIALAPIPTLFNVEELDSEANRMASENWAALEAGGVYYEDSLTAGPAIGLIHGCSVLPYTWDNNFRSRATLRTGWASKSDDSGIYWALEYWNIDGYCALQTQVPVYLEIQSRCYLGAMSTSLWCCYFDASIAGFIFWVLQFTYWVIKERSAESRMTYRLLANDGWVI